MLCPRNGSVPEPIHTIRSVGKTRAPKELEQLSDSATKD